MVFFELSPLVNMSLSRPNLFQSYNHLFVL
nr:MAG TPA: hypothetical protein [Caudoviricetes sp.]